MEKLKRLLISEYEEIKGIFEMANKDLKRLPQGNIHVYIRNKKYYMYEKVKENRKIVYIKCKDRDKACKIIQRDYNQRIVKKLEKRKKLLSQLIKSFDETDPKHIYKMFPEAKKNFINPFVIDNQSLIKQWESIEYEGKQFPEGMPEIYTEKGERVRSKTEKIIADKLLKENIPYRYEFPTKIRGFGIIYPDFTILGVHSGENIILEHFGMMDDPEYVDRAISKIQQYQLNGYVIGKSFFMTMETSVNPFNSRVLDGIIEQLKEL